MHASPLFQKEYGGPNVLFFPHPGIRQRFFRALFNRTYMKFRLFHSDFRLENKEIGVVNLTTKKHIFPFAYHINRLLFRIVRQLGGWQAVNRPTKTFFQQDFYEELFERERPCLAISLTPCQSIPDYCIQFSAEKRRIPLVFFPDSWDNFTRTGEFPFLPAKIFSWGPEMSREAREYFGFGDKVMTNVGMIRLEPQGWIPMVPEEFKAWLDIPADHKVILFPTNQHYIMAPEPRILEELVADIEQRKLGKAVLLLRPNNLLGDRQRGYVRQYRDHSCVRLNLPENDGVAAEYERPEVSWIDVLTNVDVVVTICSMMVLEAFHFDKPVVNIDYDHGILNEFGYSFRIGYRRAVYRHIRENGSTVFATSREGLNRAILQYLDDPGLHRDKRREIVELWDVPPRDGVSRCRRAFDEINRIVAEHRGGSDG
jgi:glycosyltransferase involved in cell wall biosynthesis